MAFLRQAIVMDEASDAVEPNAAHTARPTPPPEIAAPRQSGSGLRRLHCARRGQKAPPRLSPPVSVAVVFAAGGGRSTSRNRSGARVARRGAINGVLRRASGAVNVEWQLGLCHVRGLAGAAPAVPKQRAVCLAVGVLYLNGRADVDGPMLAGGATHCVYSGRAKRPPASCARNPAPTRRVCVP